MDEKPIAELSIRRFSTAFRQTYWTRHSDEPDAPILWSGLRQELGKWLARESPIVIGAITAPGEKVVVSRSVFSRSPTCRDLWYYGYFYTQPGFRRLGLGERVMRAGLNEIRRVGAQYCSCYVAEDNYASADLAIKLGFHKLPFVRVVFRDINECISHPVSRRLMGKSSASLVTDIPSLIDQILGGKDGASVITDELTIRSPWQPWKSAEDQLVQLEDDKGGNLGIGRIGPSKAVLVPNLDKLSNDVDGLILSIVSAMGEGKKRPVFAFFPRSVADSLVKAKLSGECEFYDVFWHADLQQRNL